jgi:site-specific DNA-methyltransferase (adenine-specific)
MIELLHGDCLENMKSLPDNYVDSIVTDPPYGINFMGKKWDYDIPSQEIWNECLRILKPGGYLLSFAGTRTQHRMAVRIEDAGFEIRDMIAWVYGSGFPKSLNISKAIDKQAGVEREVIGEIKTNSGGMAHLSKTNAEQGFRPSVYNGHSLDDKSKNVIQYSLSATNEVKQWDGWGTALKPALEPITMARKPLSEKTVAANVLKYGTGGINVDGCRVPLSNNEEPFSYPNGAGGIYSSEYQQNSAIAKDWNAFSTKQDNMPVFGSSLGRWPANLILTYPEDEYILRDDVTSNQLRKLSEWMSENT